MLKGSFTSDFNRASLADTGVLSLRSVMGAFAASASDQNVRAVGVDVSTGPAPGAPASGMM